MGCGSTKSAHPDILRISHNGSLSTSIHVSGGQGSDDLKSLIMNIDNSQSSKEVESTLETSQIRKEYTSDSNKDSETKPKPAFEQQLTEQEVFEKLDDVFPKLQNCTDYSTKECSSDLSFLRKYSAYSRDNERRSAYFDRLTLKGIVQLFERIWKQLFIQDFLCETESIVWNNMKCILIVMWNGTDISKKLCQMVLDNNTGNYIINLLKDSRIAPENCSTRAVYTVKGIFGIIHNTLYRTDARNAFRESGLINALKPFLHSENLMIRTKTIINLAYASTEEESKAINANDDNVSFLIKILEETLKTKDHYAKKYGFRTDETMEILNLLASNDSNKQRIAKVGAIPIYEKLLYESDSPNWQNESLQAVKGLWALSFDDTIKSEIVKSENCMEGIKSLTSEDTPADIRRAAEGALWVISGGGNREKEANNNKYGKTEDGHIMISYNWSSKPTMLKVRDRLKLAGLSVWMDVDNMTGSTLEAMANAVEKSTVVVVCLSQKYKESPSCRTEAEYAYKLRKPCIPLRLERNYNPDGWLGIMIGTKLWFDFSREERFEASISGFIKEIGNTSKEMPRTAPLIKSETSHEFLSAIPENKEKTNHQCALNSWSTDEVKKLMTENGLGEVYKKFSNFKGEDLLQLKELLVTAPEFYYSTLRDQAKMQLLQILRFTKLLKQL